MNGNLYKEADSILGRQASNFSSSTDPNDRNLGRALQDAQAELRSALSRSNPQYATQIDNLNSAWADAVRVERAAGMQGAINGRISPANLSSAVKATDNSVRDRAFSRGQARMQDLSDAAKGVLGPTIPNSATAERLMTTDALGLVGTALAGEHVPPHVLLPIVAGAGTAGAAYSRPSISALAHAIATRPPAAAPVASLVRRTVSPLGAAFGAQLGYQAGP